MSGASEREVLHIADVDLVALQRSGLVLSPNLIYARVRLGADQKLLDRPIVSGVDIFLKSYLADPLTVA